VMLGGMAPACPLAPPVYMSIADLTNAIEALFVCL
jgi:hypothetical protein